MENITLEDLVMQVLFEGEKKGTKCNDYGPLGLTSKEMESSPNIPSKEDSYQIKKALERAKNTLIKRQTKKEISEYEEENRKQN